MTTQMQPQRTAPHIEAMIRRANARAHQQAQLGNLPALLASEVLPTETHQTWAITSRTVAGTVYLVDVVADYRGVDTQCQCEAQHAGRICWHRAAARLALFGEIGHHDARGWERAGSEDMADIMASWQAADPDPFDPSAWVEADVA